MASWIAAFLAILISFAPGVLLSFALFKHTVFSRWDKFFFGLVLAFFAVPFLLFLEFLVLGLKLSTILVLANALLVCAASIAALYYQKHRFHFPSTARWGERISKAAADPKRFLLDNSVFIVLIAFLALSFYVRFATSYSPTFFEFDPYYYMKVTEHLVRDGFVQTLSPEVYYPQQLFNRVPPLTHYLTGSWYLLYSSFAGFSSYSKDVLIRLSDFYPPLAGALMAFLAFVLLREEYNEYVGVLCAGVFAFLPQLINKMEAGGPQQSPYGLFTAMLVFALYAMALSKKSNRLSLLAGFSMVWMVLSSQEFIWPFMVLTAYIGIQSILEFLSGTLDEAFLKSSFAVVAGAFVGSLMLSTYAQGIRFPLFSANLVTLIAALAFSAALYATKKLLPAQTPAERAKHFAGFMVIALIAAFLTPIAGILLSELQGQVSIASNGSALSQTIQENAATSPSIFQPSFGILNPPLVLLLVALLASLTAVLVLIKRGHKNYAIVSGVVLGALLFFSSQLVSLLKLAATSIGSQSLVSFLDFLASSSVFFYLSAALLATALYYLFSEHGSKSRTALWFMLIFFPVAYIGLNKVKYLFQLGIALALAFGYLLGESHRAFGLLTGVLKLDNTKEITRYALALILLVGVGVVFTEAQTVQSTMEQLKVTRIPSDWVAISELNPAFALSGTPASAMGWLYQNTNYYNPVTRAQCIQKFGWECRVLSWWDYGHWTTFYGETYSVLDPNNYHPEFNQETARAFVNGNLSDLYHTMQYHHATHVLVDSDLVGKWGALVFLSGTCSQSQSPTCPVKPEIDWRKGTGSSKYEAEHYFEYLTLQKDTCPSFASAVPLPLLQSSFGAYYCADNDYLYLLTQKGLDPNYKRKFTLAPNPAAIASLNASVSYLVPFSQGTLLNLNPDLSYMGLNNTVFYAAYTRLFFFERLPDFKLDFRSPNGAVRIFEYTGAQNATAIQPSPSPAALTPTPAPVLESTPLPSPQNQNATNASG